MSTPGLVIGDVGAGIDLRAKRSNRRALDRVATGVMVLSFLAVVVPLGFVLGTLISKGASILSLDFLTNDIPTPRKLGPGMGPAVIGTLLTTALASLMAIPLGVMGAVYLTEYGNNRGFTRVLRFFADVMTGVPSIVMGLFIYTIWNVRWGTDLHGNTAFAGALALGCLMLPIIIRSSEEMLRLVPSDLREASLALGSSKARTIVTVVLPAAFAGILSGVLLAVARAAGETAPVLFTVGAATKVNNNPIKGPTTTLAREIFLNANSPFPGPRERAWGAALTLVILAFLLLVIARAVASRFGPAQRS
jgi:phosphate transport system permease protein